MISRLSCIGLALCLSAAGLTDSLAASPPTETISRENPVPSGTLTHPTGLAFPARIASLYRGQVVDYEQQQPGRGLGVAYRYNNDAGLKIDVYLYDYRQTVPEGVDNPVVQGEAKRSSGEIDYMAQHGLYADVMHGPIETCRSGTTEFLCEAVRYTTQRGEPVQVRSILLLRGSKGHFFKFRMTWPQAEEAQAREAEAFVTGLLNAQPR